MHSRISKWLCLLTWKQNAEGELVFLLIVQSTFRRLWLWLSAVKNKGWLTDWRQSYSNIRYSMIHFWIFTWLSHWVLFLKNKKNVLYCCTVAQWLSLIFFRVYQMISHWTLLGVRQPSPVKKHWRLKLARGLQCFWRCDLHMWTFFKHFSVMTLLFIFSPPCLPSCSLHFLFSEFLSFWSSLSSSPEVHCVCVCVCKWTACVRKTSQKAMTRPQKSWLSFQTRIFLLFFHSVFSFHPCLFTSSLSRSSWTFSERLTGFVMKCWNGTAALYGAHKTWTWRDLRK